jgi:hypothetical protein
MVLTDVLKNTAPVGRDTLRHSLGTLMKADGEDVETIRHANFKVTMVFIHRLRWGGKTECL